ncbi:MAG TPA: hypothetical protein VFE60_14370, partial [Roseiarcus sp.]|nr:hypothetical protein [Roseiarcus sp.]
LRGAFLGGLVQCTVHDCAGGHADTSSASLRRSRATCALRRFAHVVLYAATRLAIVSGESFLPRLAADIAARVSADGFRPRRAAAILARASGERLRLAAASLARRSAGR